MSLVSARTISAHSVSRRCMARLEFSVLLSCRTVTVRRGLDILRTGLPMEGILAVGNASIRGQTHIGVLLSTSAYAYPSVCVAMRPMRQVPCGFSLRIYQLRIFNLIMAVLSSVASCNRRSRVPSLKGKNVKSKKGKK